MSDDFKIILKENYVRLIETISLKDKLLALLYQKMAITDTEKDRIQKIEPEHKGVEYLLDVLRKKSGDSFLKFREALNEDEQSHVVRILEEAEACDPSSSLRQLTLETRDTRYQQDIDEARVEALRKEKLRKKALQMAEEAAAEEKKMEALQMAEMEKLLKREKMLKKKREEK